MRRFSMLFAAALLVAPTASPADLVTVQQRNQQLQDFCYAVIDSGEFPGLNLGECMSFNLTPESGFKPHFCDFLRETDAYADFGFESYSDCVTNLEL